MKIATLTLNPAIDQTVVANHFQPNTVNRGQAMQFDAGGKGVNVASFLADYGLLVAATGFLGKENAAIFEQLFQRKGIADHFVRLPGSTRIGVKIVDEANQQTTDINLPGLTPSTDQLATLQAILDQLANDYDWFVLAGNLPPDVPPTIYATLITQLRAQGKRIVLDTSRDALINGVQAGPTVLKPNIDELQQLVGRALGGISEVAQAARELLHNGTELVVVSMGADGAVFVNQQGALTAQPPTVMVKSTVGAGDAMVAGMIAGQLANLNLADCARLATAFSVGKITAVGPHLPPRDIIQGYLEQVAINSLTDTNRT